MDPDPPAAAFAPEVNGFAGAVLWLEALAFIGFGVAFAGWPAPMASVVDILLGSPVATIDFAATYGGFEIGFGVFLCWCALAAGRVRIGLVASACALAGFALARIVTLFAVGGPGKPTWIALVLEVGGTGLALAGLSRTTA